ncbi:DUF1800 domain-containing protein [Aquabacterium soli]|uniref:DUF1800 domain-containing protein n=1 Tax=Aquabacterium soli TaxID=2493092 RepID=UPI0013151F9D|nr:DUF1800 family protein [Aquabacterium soli]
MPWPDENQAARFLNQAALGATVDGITRVTTLGYEGWLAEQMAAPPVHNLYSIAENVGWTDPAWMSTDVGLDNLLWFNLFQADDVLRQRVVLALSEIFVVSVRNMPIPYGHIAVLAFWDLLAQHCFGNFLDLLEAITLSPAMGTYLSLHGSAKADSTGRHPDENFAREVLQLFTIGLVKLDIYGEPVKDAQGNPVETYNNATVTQLARAFTGWDFDATSVSFLPSTTADYVNRPMTFFGDRYDTDPKWVLDSGNTITAAPGRPALRQALQFIFNHSNVGPFVAKQLIQRLVTSNPERNHVARVAQAFNDNGQGVRGDMKAVLRAVLLDPLARHVGLPDEQQARRGKLREPVLRLVHWGRLTNVVSNDGTWNAGNLSTSDKLAQGPMRAPSVFNFFRPGYAVSEGSGTMLAPEMQITDQSSVVGYVNYMLDVVQVGLGYSDAERIAPQYDLDGQDWDALAASPEQLVDRLNLLLTGRTLSQNTLSVVLQAVRAAQATPNVFGVGDVSQARNRVVVAFFLIMTSADYLVQR